MKPLESPMWTLLRSEKRWKPHYTVKSKKQIFEIINLESTFPAIGWTVISINDQYNRKHEGLYVTQPTNSEVTLIR